jgi:UDP-N-acetylmuramoyl-L-alanyl-D-glutamate--2,6-diaminopimelate ligase
MGAIAATYADVVIVTNDNPRSENPTEIADQIESGITGPCDLERVLDRRAAIARGIERAGEHGVVLIAGKGHEKTQETAGTVVEFDDVRVARELLGRKVSE